MSARRGSLAVEFVGMPGAGKSAVSRRVAEHLAGRGVAVAEPVRALSDRSSRGAAVAGVAAKSLRVAGEMVAHPGDALRALRAIRGTGQPSMPVLARVAFNWLMQCAVLRSSRTSGAVHLLDEGIYQALWSVGLEGRPGTIPRLGRELASALALPDVVVIVDAEAEAVAQRLGARGGHESRADRWDRADGQAVRHGSGLLDEVVDVLMKVSGRGRGPRVIHVDNGAGRDPGAVAGPLATELERWSGSLTGVAGARPDARQPAAGPLRTI